MYGKPKADKLLLNASFEIIFSNEQAQKIFLRNYKDSYGSFKNLKFLVNVNYPSNFTTPWYNLKIFNSANCAKSSLSNKMFDQYEYQYSKNSNSQMSNYIEQIGNTYLFKYDGQGYAQSASDGQYFYIYIGNVCISTLAFTCFCSIL